MKYIGLDGKEYSSIDEVTKANREVKAHPLYVKEMNRRRVTNVPGEITRDQWAIIIGKRPVDPVVIEKAVDKATKDPQFVKDLEDLIEGSPVKRAYKFSIPDTYKSVMKSAAKKGIPFDLDVLQVESLMEKKCYFCGYESEKIVTLGKRFDYKDSKAVCGTCKKVYDLLGDETHEYLDRFMK